MTTLIKWLRNRRFRLRQFTARYPWMFFLLYQLSPHNRKLMVNRKTRITIEGYPRSANTYAVYAFKQVNDLSWSEIAHHLHVQAQIIRSVSYGIPVILLIRHPLEAVRSLVVRHDFIPVDEALSDYCRFYEDLYPLREQFIIAQFEEAITHFGNVVVRLNEKFSTNFNPFPDQDIDIKRAVLNEIDTLNKQRDRGQVTHLYRPDENKDALKNAVDIDEESKLYKNALGIYLKYTGQT